MKIFWLYELHQGQGVFQGSTGPGAEGIVRRVVQLTKDEDAGKSWRTKQAPGEPFMAFVPEPGDDKDRRADDAMLKEAGFESAEHLLACYRAQRETEDENRRKITAQAELLTELRPIASKLRVQSELKVADVLSAADFGVLRRVLEGKL